MTGSCIFLIIKKQYVVSWLNSVLDNSFLALRLEFKHYWPNHAGLPMEETLGGRYN